MRSPLHSLSLDARHLLFAMSLGSLLIFGQIMSRVQEGPAPGLPRVSQKELEFSARPADASRLIRAWGSEGVDRARRLIWWDFGFLLSYAPLLALACTFAANGHFRHSERTRTVGLLLAWGSLLAAAADVGANVAMLGMLRSPASGSSLTTAKAFAYLEFTLIGLALTYLFAAALLSLLDQPRPPDA
jgi:hypothetical protein